MSTDDKDYGEVVFNVLIILHKIIKGKIKWGQYMLYYWNMTDSGV